MLSSNQEYEAFSDTSRNWDSFRLHCHDFFEFYLFFSGIPYYFVEDNVFPLRTCTLIILPPFHMHGMPSSPAVENYTRAWLYITPTIMQNISLGITDLSVFFKEAVENGKSHFYLDLETGIKLKTLIELIKKDQLTTDPAEKWKACVNIASFLSNVYDITKDAEANSKLIVPNESIQPVLNYINLHISEDLSIKELSKLFGISPSYMSRTFNSYTGRSVYNYILYRRIMLAKEMICAGKPFTEAACECGFNDYSCFLRAFQKTTKLSPRSYKKYIQSLGLSTEK